MNLTLRCGTRTLTREFPTTTRVRDLKADPSVRASLGLPENVVAVVDGTTLGDNDQLNDHDEVVFEKQAAQKA